MDGTAKEFNSVFTNCLKISYLGLSPDVFYKRKSWRYYLLYGYLIIIFIFSALMLVGISLMATDILEFLGLSYRPFIYICYNLEWLSMVGQQSNIKGSRFVAGESFCWRNSSDSDRKKAQTRFKLYHAIINFYKMIILFLVVIYIIAPTIQNIINSFYDEFELISIWPEWIEMGFILNLVMFIVDFIGLFFVCITATGQFGWMLYFMFMVQTEVEMITSAIKNLNEDVSKIKEIVQDHNACLKKCKHFLGIFEPIITCRLMLCTYGMTYALFVMATRKDEEEPYYFSAICDNTVYIIDLLVYCTVSSGISTSLNKLADAAYSAPWYEVRPSAAKNIQLVILRAQKYLEPKAFMGALKVDMRTVIDVIQLCYSYFTLLLLYNKN